MKKYYLPLLKEQKQREIVLSEIKLGRKNPFLPVNKDSDNFTSNFKLKGFISLNNKNYALIEFLDNEGNIDINSIGGANTELLPNGAMVKEINPLNETIKILFDEEIFIINVNDF